MITIIIVAWKASSIPSIYNMGHHIHTTYDVYRVPVYELNTDIQYIYVHEFVHSKFVYKPANRIVDRRRAFILITYR